MTIFLTDVSGIILVGGLILGLICGIEFTVDNEGFNLLIAIKCWIMAFIGGITFRGFAEVIKLLEDIKNKLDK